MPLRALNVHLLYDSLTTCTFKVKIFSVCARLFPRNTLYTVIVKQEVCDLMYCIFNIKAFVTGHTMFYAFHSKATNFVKPCITIDVDHVSLAVFCTSAVEDNAYKISTLCHSMFLSKLLNPK